MQIPEFDLRFKKIFFYLVILTQFIYFLFKTIMYYFEELVIIGNY